MDLIVDSRRQKSDTPATPSIQTKDSNSSKVSKKMQKFLQQPVKSPSTILLDHYRSQSQLDERSAMAATAEFKTIMSPRMKMAETATATSPNDKHQQMISKPSSPLRQTFSPLRNSVINEQLAKFHELSRKPQVPKLLNYKLSDAKNSDVVTPQKMRSMKDLLSRSSVSITALNRGSLINKDRLEVIGGSAGAKVLKQKLSEQKAYASAAKDQAKQLKEEQRRESDAKLDPPKFAHPNYSSNLPTGRGNITTQISTTEEKVESRSVTASQIGSHLPRIDGKGLIELEVSSTMDQDLCKSQIFKQRGPRSPLSSQKNSASLLDLNKNRHDQVSNDNLQKAENLLEANNVHQKSLKLLDYLEKRTEKRSKSLQQRMLDAMDRSVKKGPLKFPTKLIRQIEKEERRQKSFKQQKKQVKQDIQEEQHQQEAHESSDLGRWRSNQSHPEEPFFPDLQQTPCKTDEPASQQQRQQRQPSSKDLPPRKTSTAQPQAEAKVIKIIPKAPQDSAGQEASTQEQAYDVFIPQILSNSINLKLRADYNERTAEYAELLQANKVKAKMKAQRAVHKLLTQSDFSIDQVLNPPAEEVESAKVSPLFAPLLTENDVEKGAEKGEKASKSKLIEKSEIVCKTFELCKAYKPTKSFETGPRDYSCAEIAKAQNNRATQRLQTRFERQKSLLQEANCLTESDQDLIDRIMKEQIDDEKPNIDKTQIKGAEAELLGQKFGSNVDIESKVEVKTLQLLLNQVIKQIRGWSSRHADLLTELLKRRDAIKTKNAKQVKQVAHLVKDKLAKTVAKLQSRLQQTDHVLKMKVAMLDLSLKSQDQSEANFEKAMKLYHTGNDLRTKAETKLKQLQEKVAMWLPNFTKYANEECFKDGLRLILPDTILDETMQKSLWDTMEERAKFNEDSDMWGFQEDETPDNLYYLGESLAQKFKRGELWLRSDLSRLLQIFTVGVPSNISLEKALDEIAYLRYEKERQDKVNKNIRMELQMRFEFLQQTQSKALDMEAELDRMKDLEELVAKYKAPKIDKNIQVHLLNDTLENFIVNSRSQSPQKQKKRDKSKKNLIRSSTVQIDLGLPSMMNKKSEPDFSKLANENTQQIDPSEARKKLEKLIDIDLNHVNHPLSQAHLDKLRHTRFDKMRQKLQPYYDILNQFVQATLKHFPFQEGASAWQLYEHILNENNTELVQGLNDMEQLGNEDWRFAVVQQMCGIQFNKINMRGEDVETSNIKQAIIDKRDQTTIGFVVSLIDNLATKMNIFNYFNAGLSSEEEYLVDLDIVLISIINAAIMHCNGSKQIKKTIVPQLISIVYQNIYQAVGKVECYLKESSTHERHLFTVLYDDVETVSETVEIKFFLELIFALHKTGMGEFDYCSEDEEISYEALINFIETHLKIEIPDQLKDEDVMDIFMKKRVICLRRLKKNDKRVQRLTPDDLSRLQNIYIKQYLTLKDAFINTVRAAQNLIKLRQSIFEPVFTSYKSSNGYLNLTGTFYQCLLFISKCNVATSFIDANAQQKAYERINKRTRQLINTLKNQEQFNKIGLAKFTDVCFDIGLTTQVHGALRKIGKNTLLVPNEYLVQIKEAVEKMDFSKSEINAVLHGEVHSLMNMPSVITAIYEAQQRIQYLPNPTRFCAVKLIESTQHQKVFTVMDSDVMRPGFDVLLECGLAELAMTIEASIKQPKKEKSRSKRLKIKKLIAMSSLKRKSLHNLDSGEEGQVEDNTPEKREIAVQTDDESHPDQNDEDRVEQSEDSKDQHLMINQNLLAYDDTVRMFQSDHNTCNEIVRHEDSPLVRIKTNKTIKEQNNESGTHCSENQNRLAFIEQESGESEQDLLLCLNSQREKTSEISPKYQTQTTLMMGQTTEMRKSMNLSENALKMPIPQALRESPIEMIADVVEAGSPSQKHTVIAASEATPKTDGNKSFTAMQVMPATSMIIDHPVIEVGGQKHSANLVLSQAAYSRGFNQPKEQANEFSVVKPDIITGENKWRDEVQRHRERLEEARLTQQARFTYSEQRREQMAQESLDRSKKQPRVMQKLNSDLALIDDKSDFSGQFVHPPPQKRKTDQNRQSEQNQKFAGKTDLNQITMSGEEPRFGGDSPSTKKKKSSQKLNLMRLIGSQETEGLTEKAQKTLKLLNSFKKRKSNSSVEITKKQVSIKNFGFEQALAESGGFEVHLKQTNAQYTGMEQINTMKEHQNDNESSFMSEREDPIDEQNGPEQPEATGNLPILGIQKINLEQRSSLARAQLAKLKKDGSHDDLMRLQSAVTLMARYDGDDISFKDDDDQEEIQ